MNKLWLLASRQALAPTAIIWALVCGGIYWSQAELNMFRSIAVLPGIYLFMLGICRFDLQRQRRVR